MPYVHTGIGSKKEFFTEQELDYREADFAEAFAAIASDYATGEISRSDRDQQQRRLDVLRTVAPAYREREDLKRQRSR